MFKELSYNHSLISNTIYGRLFEFCHMLKINKVFNYKYLLDSLIILLNISNSYSIIPYLLFFQYNRAVNTGIIFLLNIIFLLFRFKCKIKFTFPSLLTLYVLICGVNVISSFLSSTGFFLTWLYLIANLSFFLILFN